MVYLHIRIRKMIMNYMSEYSFLRGSKKYHDYSLSINKDNTLIDIIPDVSKRELLNLLNSYPDEKNTRLKELLQKQFGIQRVLIGSGSEDIILRINRILLKNMIVGVVTPNFYRTYETLCCQPILIDVSYNASELFLDIEELMKKISHKKFKAIWISNPNPITGKAFNKKMLTNLVEMYNTILFLIDEASIDSAKSVDEISMLEIAEKYNNLIVIRSFSKFYGFPGMRLGFAVGSERYLKIIENNSPIYPVNNLNIIIVESIFKNIDKYITIKDRLSQNKEKLRNVINNTNLYYIDSLTNTIIVGSKLPGLNLWEYLMKNKIIALSLDGEHGIITKNCVRLTVHSGYEEFEFLYDRIKAVANG